MEIFSLINLFKGESLITIASVIVLVLSFYFINPLINKKTKNIQAIFTFLALGVLVSLLVNLIYYNKNFAFNNKLFFSVIKTILLSAITYLVLLKVKSKTNCDVKVVLKKALKSIVVNENLSLAIEKIEEIILSDTTGIESRILSLLQSLAKEDVKDSSIKKSLSLILKFCNKQKK